jgi:ureidoacrylate peracid hydrolase
MTGPRSSKVASLAFEERIDPASTALVVIDVQNDFAVPQVVCGAVGDDVSPVAPMIDRVKSLIAAARQADLFIIFVRAIYDEVVLSPALAEQYLRRGYPNGICLTGSRGAELVEGIGPRDAPNEIVVTKHRYSAFWGSSIDLFLRTNGIQTLVLTGIATEVCVESTARDAFFRDYNIVVPADCVGSYSEERQKASLAVLARSFGIVTSSTELTAVWKKLGNGPRNWHPDRRAQRELTTIAKRIAPEHTALLLVTGRCSAALPASIGARIRGMTDHARRAGCLVLHGWSAPQANKPAAGVLASEIPPCRGEQVILCHGASAFADTQLEILLRSNGIRTVILAGSETHISVESTVREVFDRNYHAIVAEDCVYAPQSEHHLHTNSLAIMQRHFADLISSDQILSHWLRSE